MRRFLTLLGVAVLALSACGRDDKPAPTIPITASASAPDNDLANLILSWCIAGFSSTEATRQAADAGLTAAQAELAVEQLEAMKAATDQC